MKIKSKNISVSQHNLPNESLLILINEYLRKKIDNGLFIVDVNLDTEYIHASRIIDEYRNRFNGSKQLSALKKLVNELNKLCVDDNTYVKRLSFKYKCDNQLIYFTIGANGKLVYGLTNPVDETILNHEIQALIDYIHKHILK